MWWSASFPFSVWTRLPVNTIQSRNNWNCSASNHPSILCQYVVVSFFLSQCVDAFVCERISSRKNWNASPPNPSCDSCQYVVVSFSSIVSIWLFQFFLVSLRGRFDVINERTLTISSSMGTNHFHQFIFDNVLLLTCASFRSSPSSSVDGLTSFTPGLYQSQAA